MNASRSKERSHIRFLKFLPSRMRNQTSWRKSPYILSSEHLDTFILRTVKWLHFWEINYYQNSKRQYVLILMYLMADYLSAKYFCRRFNLNWYSKKKEKRKNDNNWIFCWIILVYIALTMTKLKKNRTPYTFSTPWKKFLWKEQILF